MKKKTETIRNTAIVYDSILNLEKRIGILLPLEELTKQIREDSKKHGEKIKVGEINEILKALLVSGIVFYPRKGYIERISAYKNFNFE